MTPEASLVSLREALAYGSSPANKRLTQLLDTYTGGGGDFITLRRGLIQLLEAHIADLQEWDTLFESEASIRYLESREPEVIAEHRAGLTKPMDDLWEKPTTPTLLD